MEESVDQGQDHLLFRLGNTRFGVRVAEVEEVLRAAATVAVPGAPAFVEGVLNLRGFLVPVLDVRGRFDLPAKACDPADHLMVVRVERRRVCLRVDRVMGLEKIDPLDIEPTALLVPGASLVAGLAKRPDGIILIHDLATFLSATEAAALAVFENDCNRA